MRRTAGSIRMRGAMLATLGVALACSDDPTGPTASARGDEVRAATAVGAPVTPVDLGTPGASSGVAADVNDGGIIVGSMQGASGMTTVVRWHPGGAMDTVPLASAIGIGNDGSVIGEATGCVAARWVPGAGVTTAPSFTSGGCMRALAVSPDGRVVVGGGAVPYGPPTFSLENPFIWIPSWQPPYGPINLGGILGWRYGTAFGVNVSAQSVGALTQAPPAFIEQAFVASSQAGIRLIGAPRSRATAINASGVIVGYQSARAVRFHAGSSYVDELLPGVTQSEARSVNDKGEIAINASPHAYLLRGGTLVPLAPLPGGSMVIAMAVNERSQVVGWAYDARGVQRPVLWDVDAPPLVATAGGPYAGVEGAAVAFSGGATGAGPTATYAWSFGDGTTATGANATHAYANDGSYPVTLTVVDGARQAAASTTTTIANAAPTIDMAPGGTVYSGETFTVRARFDDPGVHDAPWRWTLLDQDGTLRGSGEATSAPDSIRAPVTLLRAGTYRLSLTVTDRDGGTTGGVAPVDVLRLPVPMTVAPPSLHAARRGNGLLTATLFATAAVDPSRIDVATVRLGNGLAPATRGAGAPMAKLEDVDGDGVPELVLKFERAGARDALTGSGGMLVLHADLVDGRQVEGRWRWPSPATGQ